MPVTRVTHNLLFGGQTTNILKTQREYLDLVRQNSTGERFSFLSEFPSTDIRRLISYDSEVFRAEQYRSTITRVRERNQQIETNLQSIIDKSSEFRSTLLSAASGGNADNIPLADLGRALYDDISSFLNLNREGAYLFAGARTDRPPVTSYDQMLRNLNSVLRPRPTPTGSTGVESRSSFTPPGRTVPERTAFLNTDHLAETEAIDPITGYQVRMMQVIDFFTGDETFGSLARTTANGDIAERANLRVRLQGIGFPNPPDGTVPSSAQSLQFDRLYYQGDARQITARIDNELQVEYGARADESGLAQILLSATMLGIGDGSGVDLFNDDLNPTNSSVPLATGSPQTIDQETRINAAIELLNRALLTIQDNARTPQVEQSVSQIKARVGSVTNRLGVIEDNNRRTSELFESLTSQIRDVDLTETITRAESLQTILQYSYQILRSTTQLSIVNFLR